MRQKKNLYEYISVYIDNLIIAEIDAKNITDTLMIKYKFKLKGIEPIKYYLGCDFFRDSDNFLCFLLKHILTR